MIQDNDKNFAHSENTFGTGFVLGAAFAGLALFFLGTKTGANLLKKISDGNWDVSELDKLLDETFTGIDEKYQVQSEENLDEISPTPFEPEEEAKYTSVPILGKRFFYRRK